MGCADKPPKITITTAKQPRPTRHTYDFIKDFIKDSVALFPTIYQRKG